MEKGTPLLAKIIEYLQQGITGFHTPGHQQGQGCGEKFRGLMEAYSLKMDLTEIPGLDNLRTANGCLAESQKLAAELFGSKETLFLVNGSTIGIQAALLAINNPGEKIIVARNAHTSVVNGLILSGGIPILAPVEVDVDWGFPLGISLEKLQSVLENNTDAAGILLTNPEYRGTSIDIAKAIELIKRSNLPLIVDEAHGSHLFFQKDLPISSQQYTPDIVVQSTHKTLGALTQASMLHINNIKWSKPVQSALNVLHTTSPSYLLLASLDGVQEQMRIHGREIISGVIELAQYFRTEVGKLGYRIYEADEHHGWYQDKTKVLVSAADMGITGWELSEILHSKYGIAVEMSDYYYVLFLLSIGHDYPEVNKAIKALSEICKQNKRNSLMMMDNTSYLLKQNYQPIVSPREVFYSTKEIIELTRAQGRIIAEPVVLYPPGIPLLWPGEELRQEHIDCINQIKMRPINVQGIYTNGMVSVLTKR